MAFALALVIAMSNTPEVRLARNVSLIAALDAANELSKSGTVDPKRIDAIVGTISEPDDLRRLALTSYAMTNGLAEYESLDNVWWAMFWASARKLAERTDENSVMQLELVAGHAQLGGGELMTMNELRAAQQKRRNPHNH